MIKAIKTEYNGYRFRSRLEARWAVFFDALGVKWEYEPEGYSLSDGTLYLPDFWMPSQQCFIEIKGQYPGSEEIRKAQLLSDGSGHWVDIFFGQPGDVAIIGFRDGKRSDKELMLSICGNCSDLVIGAWQEYQPLRFYKDGSEENDGPPYDIFFSHCYSCHGMAPPYQYTDEQWKANCKIESAINAAKQARFEHGATNGY
jgi:hypothetical protein